MWIEPDASTGPNEPPVFVAVTLTETKVSSSAGTVVYVEEVAPPMLAPSRVHWYANECAPAPPMCAHVPGVAVSTEPGSALPEIVGATEFVGGGSTGVTAFELADAAPCAFVAVTLQRMDWPSSASVSRYVVEVSPTMLEPFRCH